MSAHAGQAGTIGPKNAPREHFFSLACILYNFINASATQRPDVPKVFGLFLD